MRINVQFQKELYKQAASIQVWAKYIGSIGTDISDCASYSWVMQVASEPVTYMQHPHIQEIVWVRYMHMDSCLAALFLVHPLGAML